MSELEKMRDPDAHRRELLPHQKHLALGIAGEIRTSMIKYRSKKETSDDCFPRIESARDSLGNIWTSQRESKMLHTGCSLHPEDTIDFIITASDPEDLSLRYQIVKGTTSESDWQDSNNFFIKITKKDISKDFRLSFYIKSPRDYHAYKSYDDSVHFFYSVLP